MMDNGHYHPTEVVSPDKIPALLTFFPEIALHVTRPIRWIQTMWFSLMMRQKRSQKRLFAARTELTVHILHWITLMLPSTYLRMGNRIPQLPESTA